MSTLTLDVGGAALSVNCQKAGHAAPRKVGGDRSFAFSGAESPATRAEAMVVPVVLAPYSPATVATIRAMFALGEQVPCAGDVFNNGGGTSDWSAAITDELHETADRVTVSMTLYEVEPANVSALVRTFIDFTVITSVDDPGDDSIDYAKIGAGTLGGSTELRVLDAVAAVDLECGSIPDSGCDCPAVLSTVPERSFMTLPLAATEIAGLMTVQFGSKGGTADQWASQNIMCKIFLVRGGVDVEEADTAYAASNGGFSGGIITMSTSAVVWDVEDGDKIRTEVWGRLALHCGYGDGNDGSNLDRQTIGWGAFSGEISAGRLSVGGIVEVL